MTLPEEATSYAMDRATTSAQFTALQRREQRGGQPVGLSARQAWGRMKAAYEGGRNVEVRR